jgi:uncharacterized protein (TIGR03085 family)
MSREPSPARREREALCDLFVELGPDAPTLCGEWTTRDLAAHLVVRERRPDAAVGILVSKAAGYLDKVQADVARTDWPQLVQTVRSGPPRWSPTSLSPIDKLANTVEFFVHHEDVRRGSEPWEPRELDPELAESLRSLLPKMARRLVSSSPVGIVLEPAEGDPIVAKAPGPNGWEVTVRGDVGELVLFVFGRQAHSRVDVTGDAAAVQAARDASFGI